MFHITHVYVESKAKIIMSQHLPYSLQSTQYFIVYSISIFIILVAIFKLNVDPLIYFNLKIRIYLEKCTYSGKWADSL